MKSQRPALIIRHRPLPHPAPARDAATLTASPTDLLNLLRAGVRAAGRLGEADAFETQGHLERSTSTPARTGER